jgi:hypothetical protein
MTRILLLFAFLLFLFPSAVQSTEVFWCGSEIVKVGDSAETVKNLCGKPGRTESSGAKSSQKKSKKSKTKTDDIETTSAKSKKWYYDRGYGDFVYILTFKGNTLNKIQTSERGGK